MKTKKRLSKEEQIKVLERVILRMSVRTNYTGICFVLSVALCSTYNEISELISKFTITNARSLATKYKFQYPDGTKYGYWWEKDKNFSNVENWYAPRIAFLKALIEELKEI